MSIYTRNQQEQIVKLVKKYSKKKVLKALTLNEITNLVNNELELNLSLQYIKWLKVNNPVFTGFYGTLIDKRIQIIQRIHQEMRIHLGFEQVNLALLFFPEEQVPALSFPEPFDAQVDHHGINAEHDCPEGGIEEQASKPRSVAPMKCPQHVLDPGIQQEPDEGHHHNKGNDQAYQFGQAFTFQREWNDEEIGQVKHDGIEQVIDHEILVLRGEPEFPEVEHEEIWDDHKGDPENQVNDDEMKFFHEMARCSKVKILCLPSTKNHNNNRLNGRILG